MSSTRRDYSHQFGLKYGCNPHQNPANIYSVGESPLPFTILNGRPGYINILDALNAWQLVLELKKALGLPAAASFKHVSPAGAAVATPLSDTLKKAYGVEGIDLTPQAIAYIRARNADPKSSFGDFVALSDVVDEATAKILKSEVSDGIIAPGFDPEALRILSEKKSGAYIVLQADEAFVPPQQEFREVFGCVFEQRRNDVQIVPDMFRNPVTLNKELSESAVRDMVLASITIKYTQSNSVGYALDGQMIGIGAGQQSRVDCVKLAGQKVEVWYLRQHPKVLNMEFSTVKKINRVKRINAMIKAVEGDFTDPEFADWLSNFEGLEKAPAPLSTQEKADFMKTLKRVTISSDAFFPFRDNIDQASKRGVQYIAQPGGSVQDEAVIKACADYGMVMVFTNTRLFQH